MSIAEEQIHLRIRDRLNYTQIIENWFKTIQRLLPIQGMEKELLYATNGLISMIPDDFKDEQFHKENVVLTYRQDVRPRWCGIPLSLETCKEQGIQAFKEVKTLNPEVTIQAVVNLLYRLGMITQKRFTEFFSGRKIAGGIELSEAEVL